MTLCNSTYVSKERQKEHEEKFGGYSWCPPNFQPCEPGEFWSFFGSYGTVCPQEHRQFVLPDEVPTEKVHRAMGSKPMSSVHMFYGSGDKGYAVVVDYWDYDENKPVPYVPRFFKFYLCDHEIKHTRNLGNCYNEYQCTKCGWTYNIDSSG